MLETLLALLYGAELLRVRARHQLVLVYTESNCEIGLCAACDPFARHAI